MTTTIRARPTSYRTRDGHTIHMRSRLEADFARYLDHWRFTWQYEPDMFASYRGQYLADFRAVEPYGVLYVEVKPRNWLADHAAEVPGKLKEMSIIWEHHPDAYLTLVPWSYGATELGERMLGRDGEWTRIKP